MDPETSDIAEPKHLRLLRQLVTILTITLIFGVVTIVGLLVTSVLGQKQTLVLPETLALPADEKAQAFTKGTDWIAVVTLDGNGTERIRMFGADGKARQVIDIER